MISSIDDRYDQTLFEDTSVNRMRESLNLFNQILSLQWFRFRLYQANILIDLLWMSEIDLFPTRVHISCASDIWHDLFEKIYIIDLLKRTFCYLTCLFFEIFQQFLDCSFPEQEGSTWGENKDFTSGGLFWRVGSMSLLIFVLFFINHKSIQNIFLFSFKSFKTKEHSFKTRDYRLERTMI